MMCFANLKRASAIIACVVMLFCVMTILPKGHMMSLGVRIGACVSFFVVVCVLWGVEHFQGRNVAVTKARSQSAFDWGMHYFRGFAICMIAITHILQQIGHHSISKAFFQGGTIYFLFISGYLCQYLDTKRRTPCLEYYKKKLLNVAVPYLIFSILTLLAVNVFNLIRTDVIKPHEFSPWYVLSTIAFGRAQGPYWYIPFVALLFLFSPFLVRMKSRTLVVLTVVMFFVALHFPTRTIYYYWRHPEFINLYTYFSWTYLLGMVYARFKDEIDLELRRNFILLLLGGLVVGLWLLRPGLFGFQSCSRDFAMAIQKVLFTGALLVLLERIRNKKIVVFDWLAQCSFTIFFLHMFFIAEVVAVKGWLLSVGLFTTWTGWLIDFTLILAFLLSMLGVSMLLKCALGRFSRNIVGS